MNLTEAIRRCIRGHRGAQLFIMAGALAAQPALAAAPADEELAEAVVQGDRLNVMQNEPVSSVFGFGKKVEETPRAVTTISQELLEKTIITEIDDLVAMTPGSYTQSFFGVAGSLDVRGNPGENYFRGVKRIDNPGNYPTAIGASDRIDIVRGPASPIYGPSKIGGYLNFIPKAARATNGRYLGETTGSIGGTFGSYDKRVLNAEVGGPLSTMGKEGGYYLYGESENSGSYYENTDTQQTILQASFDFQLGDVWRTEFGGMYQYFKGNQVAGWNRLTQDLIDNGTYITGSPRSLDTNGDGYLLPAEANAANGGNGLFAFYPFWDPATTPDLALTSTGTTKLKGSQVLVQEDDNLEDDVVTLYYDMIGEYANGLTLQNKLYFESLQNSNENAYGFSQFADTYVVEDQFNVSLSKDFQNTKANFQLGASIRYQDFEHGDNFDFEYFDRRDLSLGTSGSPIDRRGMATRGQENYSQHTVGRYVDYGLGLLTDLTFFEKLNFVGGLRYDYLDMTSNVLADSNTNPGLSAADTDDAVSWSASLSYELPGGFRPYATVAKQSTLILGQGGQIPYGNLDGGNAIGSSKLKEFGVKGTFLGGKLFAAVDYFDQERTDYNAQDTVTNNSTKSKGWEGELRWVATDMLTITGAYTNLKVINLGDAADAQFSFMGAEDLIKAGINPAAGYGGTVGWSIATPDHRKAGVPENIYSLNLLMGFDRWIPGLSGTLSGTHVDAVWSGYSKAVRLPSYFLVNAGVRYEKGAWSVGLQSKNLTNERYFRSNFPDLFGSSVVLPEMPRTWLVTADYKF
jgi:iron complex outermembrane receptor protein